MDIRYVSGLSSERLINQIHQLTGVNPGYAVQKFSRLVVKGLMENGEQVEAFTCPPIVRNISKKLYIHVAAEKENGVTYKYIPFINIPIIKHICVFIYSFISTFIWGCSRRKEKAVVCDVLAISVCLGTLLGAKLFGIRTVGVVTDIYGLMVGGSKNWLSKIAEKINNMYVSSFDKYVLLTEAMNDIVNPKHRPYIVMEALCDESITHQNGLKFMKDIPRVVMYAGGLYERYGLKMLVDAFIKADTDARLVLYGSGSYIDELKNVCHKHPNVEYRGVAPNEEVVAAQARATLLVNPRFTTEEFTKYSFPSKNMEYMASGTPLLTTKLPGMPSEYHKYVYLIEDESLDGFVSAIKAALAHSEEELMDFGQSAKQFVLKQKNNVIQAKRIIDLIDKE